MTRSRRQVEAARRKRVQAKREKAAGKKELGVPQLGRFAARLQQQNENRQKRAAEARRRREEARETEVGQRRSLAGLQHDALRRQREFEHKEVVVTQADAQEEASLRQYGRELRKVLAASDVVLEVLDARDPQGCRSPQLEAAVRRAGHRQRLVLILNKIDLVPRDVVAAWLKYLRAEFPTVAFKACTQQQSRNLKQSRLPAVTAPEDVLAGSACVGADSLLRVLANYSRSGEVKTTITVGVVGYPNVGKSSLINSLKRSRACGVGAAPGVTKCLQAVQLDRHIQLLDCPGVVMETGTSPTVAPLRAALAPQRLRDPLSPAAAILRRCPPEQLSELYGVPPCADPRQFLSHLARRQGRLRPGGLPDPHAAAVALLRDWTSGKISYYTHPPKIQGVQLEAQIVTTLGPALDLEALERGDAEALAAIPATVTGIGLSPCIPNAETDEKYSGEEEVAMEDDIDNLELGAVTVELKPRVKTRGSKESSAPRAPRLEEVATLDPLLQGQGLKAASKRRKKLQKRADKIATKLSETLEAAMQF
ncbi:guanine nucleotide-binding protein-like 3-like protein [Falco naumanni]|uniref:guanine nucleotide-binding protein-like 3-like protein n=1 Tax=Falco naumanni TaxID=148594 RepID=UPI001ADE1994|nr:guanine nucleotide-binding protein-like 3-like protein [Falco naumanni]XP_040473140.1 guanine nucleotide-binding protein-like 3-like protein [Falco naumanni]